MHSELSRLPRVDRVVARPELEDACARLGRAAVTDLVRAEIDEARVAARSSDPAEIASEDGITARVRARAEALLGARSRRVINATGVILHTNLGRAPLAASAATEVRATLRGACSIELDLSTGKRGKRGAFADAALAALAGAEAAMVVNNCAAAVLLMLAGIARGRGVVVSRGELVEIGGGFRVPEIMAESGAELIEVGTTNRTRALDYARALDARPDAAAILRVHQGNFRQTGFVERPSLGELGALARERGLPLLKDLGGGALIDLSPTGFVGEPTVRETLAAGVTLVAFSTDKVLGGPQGGALVGSHALVDRLKKHPLARALRVGRLPLVALESTLALYLEGRAKAEVPALAMAHGSIDDVRARARGWAETLAEQGLEVAVVDTSVEMGGGTLAGRAIPSAGIALVARDETGATEIAARLRRAVVPVVSRIEEGRVVLDARTVGDDEDADLIAAVVSSIRD